MSSYAYAKFYGKTKDEWKSLTDMLNFNKLKSLSTYRGYLDSDYINSCDGVDDPTYEVEEYFGLVPKDVVFPPEDVEWTEYVEGGYIVHLVAGAEKSYKDKTVNLPFEILKDKDKVKKEYVTVFFRHIYQYNGGWYDVNSFVNARDRFEKILAEKYCRYFKLKSLKDTAEYFKLDEESQFRFNEEISNLEEDIEEVKQREYICQFMIDMIELYKWSGDERLEDVKVFIHIS